MGDLAMATEATVKLQNAVAVDSRREMEAALRQLVAATGKWKALNLARHYGVPGYLVESVLGNRR